MSTRGLDENLEAKFHLPEAFHANPKTAVAWFERSPWLQSGESLPLQSLVDICMYLGLAHREAGMVIEMEDGDDNNSIPHYVKQSKVTPTHLLSLSKSCNCFTDWLVETFLSEGRRSRYVLLST
jgi:hypothetical protein